MPMALPRAAPADPPTRAPKAGLTDALAPMPTPSTPPTKPPITARSAASSGSTRMVSPRMSGTIPTVSTLTRATATVPFSTGAQAAVATETAVAVPSQAIRTAVNPIAQNLIRGHPGSRDDIKTRGDASRQDCAGLERLANEPSGAGLDPAPARSGE